MTRETRSRRRWEDLGADCLVNIFEKLGVTDLATSVPLCCKSWREASLSPLSWQVLNMDADVFSDFPRLVSFLIGKGRGSSTCVIYPDDHVPAVGVIYLLERCPALEVLALPRPPRNWSGDEEKIIYQLAARQKNLRYLFMRYKPVFFEESLEELSRHSKNLVGLQVCGRIHDADAVAITALLPKLKCLCLNGSRIEKSTLLWILKGCGELEELRVEGCSALQVDREVLTGASQL